MNNKNLFFWELGELKVEDQVYKLPTSYLARKSTKFNNLLSRQANGSAANGDLNKNGPVQLDGVNKVDFETFLSVVLEFKVEPAFHSDEDWMVVLRLANLWGFGELRKIAIETLSNSQTAGWSATDHVLFGRKFKVEKWVRFGYSLLVTRQMKVKEEEAEKIGWKTALKLSHVREEKAEGVFKSSETPANAQPKFDFGFAKGDPSIWAPPSATAILDRTFEAEFKSLREVEAMLAASPPVSEQASAS